MSLHSLHLLYLQRQALRTAFPNVAELLQESSYKFVIYEQDQPFLEQISNSTSTEQICVLYDVRIPTIRCYEVFAKIVNQFPATPVVAVSDSESLPLVIQAMQLGPTAILRSDTLLTALQHSIDLAIIQASKRAESAAHKKALDELNSKMSSLTLRERDVYSHLVQGKLNKQVGESLGISTKTVEMHRSNLVKKLGVRSMIQLGSYLRSSDA